jgi:hypothetical protein
MKKVVKAYVDSLLSGKTEKSDSLFLVFLEGTEVLRKPAPSKS